VAHGGAQPLALEGAEARHVLVGGGDGVFDAAIGDPARRVAGRYGVGDAGGLVVIRPDGYVGLRAALGDRAAVDAYLARVVAPGA
jgi:hypothetical protein